MITIFPNTDDALLLVPSELKWSLNDVSPADSGRDMTGYMYKNRITMKRKLEMTFKGVDWARAAQITEAFTRQEYFQVLYPDILSGIMEIRTFYRGDIETEAYVWFNGKKVMSTLSFNIIER